MASFCVGYTSVTALRAAGGAFNCLAMALEVEQHGCERHAWPPGAAIFTLFGAAGSASMVAAAVAPRWHFLAALDGLVVLCAERDAHDATAVP